MTLMLRDLSAGQQCRHPKPCPNMLILCNLDTDWLVIWNSIVLMLRPFEYCAHMTEEHFIYTLTLRPRQKSRHFAHNFANNSNYFFLKYENYFSIQISMDLLINCPVERSQHWFRQLSGIEQVTGQYLNMMTSSNGSIFRVTGPVNSLHKGQRRGALIFSLVTRNGRGPIYFTPDHKFRRIFGQQASLFIFLSNDRFIAQ